MNKPIAIIAGEPNSISSEIIFKSWKLRKQYIHKPMFVIANINSDTSQNDLTDFQNKLDSEIKFITIDVRTEQDIGELDDKEKQEFLKEMGDNTRALDKIINSGYKLLQLKTFFTSGPKETRAWSAKKDFNARDCSGIIHTDIKKGFIKLCY